MITAFGTPATPTLSAIFVDFEAVMNFRISGGRNSVSEIYQLLAQIKRLEDAGVALTDNIQGRILLRAIPPKWNHFAAAFMQEHQLADVGFTTVRKALIDYITIREALMIGRSASINRIPVVERRGKPP
jgi:hypothetical protein